jgi:hypothetical protein
MMIENGAIGIAVNAREIAMGAVTFFSAAMIINTV